MSERARLTLLAIALLLFSVAVSEAALVGKGSDGKTYLSLDEQEVENLGARMKAMADTIKRLEDERKKECGLI